MASTIFLATITTAQAGEVIPLLEIILNNERFSNKQVFTNGVLGRENNRVIPLFSSKENFEHNNFEYSIPLNIAGVTEEEKKLLTSNVGYFCYVLGGVEKNGDKPTLRAIKVGPVKTESFWCKWIYIHPLCEQRF